MYHPKIPSPNDMSISTSPVFKRRQSGLDFINRTMIKMADIKNRKYNSTDAPQLRSFGGPQMHVTTPLHTAKIAQMVMTIRRIFIVSSATMVLIHCLLTLREYSRHRTVVPFKDRVPFAPPLIRSSNSLYVSTTPAIIIPIVVRSTSTNAGFFLL